MSDLLSRPLSLPLLERHRTPPSGEEILERFVERYASRSLGERIGAAPEVPVAESAPAEDEPTVLFTLPSSMRSPKEAFGTMGEEEATRVVEAHPETTDGTGGRATVGFGAAAAEPDLEATRVLEAPPGGVSEEVVGTPTVGFEAVAAEPDLEATRVLEAPPGVSEEVVGTPTVGFEAVAAASDLEATRVLETAPEESEDGGPEDEPSGTPTVAMVAGEAPRKKKKRRHR